MERQNTPWPFLGVPKWNTTPLFQWAPFMPIGLRLWYNLELRGIWRHYLVLLDCGIILATNTIPPTNHDVLWVLALPGRFLVSRARTYLSENSDGKREMGRYERLERLIKINALIRTNLELSRSKSGVALRSQSCKSDLAKHECSCLYSAKDNRELAGNRVR